jgi:hypothetical protein
MPADGTIVAAHCHERRYRHIPFFRQLADEQARIVLRRIISGAQCAQKVEPLIGVIHANAARSRRHDRSGNRICAANRELYGFFIMQKCYELEG